MNRDTIDNQPPNDAGPGIAGPPPESLGANQAAASTPNTDPDPAADESAIRRIKDLPREFGVMLVSVGVLGVVLPGVMGAPALVAGGLVLWPGTFERMNEWLRRRNPSLYQRGMKQVGRFLDDLERRYPTAQ
jgi:hypothetical protein